LGNALKSDVGGKLIASVKDVDGNIIGIQQNS